MTQPCNAVELLLFDAASLDDVAVREVIEAAKRSEIRRGAFGAIDAIVRSPVAASLDFWVEGESRAETLDAVAALTGIEPSRMLFVSTHDASRVMLEQSGAQVAAPIWDEINRLLV